MSKLDKKKILFKELTSYQIMILSLLKEYPNEYLSLDEIGVRLSLCPPIIRKSIKDLSDRKLINLGVKDSNKGMPIVAYKYKAIIDKMYIGADCLNVDLLELKRERMITASMYELYNLIVYMVKNKIPCVKKNLIEMCNISERRICTCLSKLTDIGVIKKKRINILKDSRMSYDIVD